MLKKLIPSVVTYMTYLGDMAAYKSLAVGELCSSNLIVPTFIERLKKICISVGMSSSWNWTHRCNSSRTILFIK